MKTLYLDLTRGISGDMFTAACLSFMDEERRSTFLRRAEKTIGEFGGTCRLEEVGIDSIKGHAMIWEFREEAVPRSGSYSREKVRALCRSLNVTDSGDRFALKVIDDLVEAEARAHGATQEEIHLHEIGRTAGLMNIASAGLCRDLLGLENARLIASYVSIGDGEVATAHGRLRVPTPASTELLAGLRFRFGPYAGEMATPTGIAIVRNIIGGQLDVLPKASRTGVGFGGRTFGGERGFAVLFESGDAARGDG